ncbi:MAG: zinc-ribbon domain-containing protein [Oscillospiraceae bacterium]|nr:zinc-ribbon domain-containing protein [Oscillospiraceae bacterium]
MDREQVVALVQIVGIFTLVILLIAHGLVGTFCGYKGQAIFRILPGFFSGLLISAATGFLILMDGTKGPVIRFFIKRANGNVISFLLQALTDGDVIWGVLGVNSNHKSALEILIDQAPAKAIAVFLFCVVCAIVCAALEKPGVFLELFAYGYTLVALFVAFKGSSAAGAILGIGVGVILGVLGYKISRMWIIITTSFVGGVVLTSPLWRICSGIFASIGVSDSYLPLIWISMALPLMIIGICKQRKETAIPAGKRAAQPTAVPAGPAAPLKQAAPSPAQPQTAPAAKGTSPTGEQKFCVKCGSPLDPSAKFCGKCGHPARGGEDAEKPV